MSIAINIDGLQQATDQLTGLSRRIVDVTPIARALLLALQADVDERFDSSPSVASGGTVYGGIQWEKLTDSYLKRNPRRQGGQILRDTGELLQSYQVGQTGNISQVRPTEITFGSALPKARGLANKRPQLIVHDGLIEVLDNIVSRWVVEGEK